MNRIENKSLQSPVEAPFERTSNVRPAGATKKEFQSSFSGCFGRHRPFLSEVGERQPSWQPRTLATSSKIAGRCGAVTRFHGGDPQHGVVQRCLLGGDRVAICGSVGSGVHVAQSAVGAIVVTAANKATTTNMPTTTGTVATTNTAAWRCTCAEVTPPASKITSATKWTWDEGQTSATDGTTQMEVSLWSACLDVNLFGSRTSFTVACEC